MLLNLNSKEANPPPVFKLQSVLSSVGIIKDNELRIFPVFKLRIMMCLERTIDFFNSRVGATFQSTLINFTGKTSEAVPILRWRNLKTQLYFYGSAYLPHRSVTKTQLYVNALQTGRI